MTIKTRKSMDACQFHSFVRFFFRLFVRSFTEFALSYIVFVCACECTSISGWRNKCVFTISKIIQIARFDTFALAWTALFPHSFPFFYWIYSFFYNNSVCLFCLFVCLSVCVLCLSLFVSIDILSAIFTVKGACIFSSMSVSIVRFFNFWYFTYYECVPVRSHLRADVS